MRRIERCRLAGAMGAACLMLLGCTSGEQPRRGGERASGAPESSAPAGFSVVASGDVLIHPRITEQAVADGGGQRDYRPIFAGIKPAVSQADLALCHLEVPIAPAAGPFAGYPLFSAPPEVVRAIADTGYDSCSTASNHTLDTGPAGVRRTLDALDAAGVRHTGSARSKAESGRPPIIRVRGVRVAHLSYTFGFNGMELPEDKPWLSNPIDPAAILADARAARGAGAEVVIASMHWGTENQHETTGEQRALAKRLLADDSIDLLVGHHAHVVQPFQKVDGKWVAYGLGNSLARHDEPKGSTEEGVLARFHFAPDGNGWAVRTAEYLPTLVDLRSPIRLVALNEAGDAVPPRRRQQALRRTEDVVGSLGAEENGLVRAR